MLLMIKMGKIRRVGIIHHTNSVRQQAATATLAQDNSDKHTSVDSELRQMEVTQSIYPNLVTFVSTFNQWGADYHIEYRFLRFGYQLKALPGKVDGDAIERIEYSGVTPSEVMYGKLNNPVNIPLPFYVVTPAIRAELEKVASFGHAIDNSVTGQWLDDNGYLTTISTPEEFTYDGNTAPQWFATFGNQMTDPAAPYYCSPTITLSRSKVGYLIDTEKNKGYFVYYQVHTNFTDTVPTNGGSAPGWPEQPHEAFVIYERDMSN